MNATVISMIEDALISDGVEEVFKINKNSSESSVDIFSDIYLEKINRIKLPNTRIKLLQRLLSQAIGEYKKTNLIKGVDFSKKLKNLIDLYNERKDFEISKIDVLDDLAEKFASLFRELQGDRSSYYELGISFEEKAFYDILKSVAMKYDFEYPEDKFILLAKEVKSIVDDKARYTDWAQKLDIKAELKVDLILTLDRLGYPPVPKDEVFQEIFIQAENFKRYLSY
jgi:type I restriction enzyme R subunit